MKGLIRESNDTVCIKVTLRSKGLLTVTENLWGERQIINVTIFNTGLQSGLLSSEHFL